MAFTKWWYGVSFLAAIVSGKFTEMSYIMRIMHAQTHKLIGYM